MLITSAKFTVNADRLESSEKQLEGTRDNKKGIKTHNCFIGFILSIFGKATKMQIDVSGTPTVFYINTNSFKNWRAAVFNTIYTDQVYLNKGKLRALLGETKFGSRGLYDNFKEHQKALIKPLAKALAENEKAKGADDEQIIAINNNPYIKWGFTTSDCRRKVKAFKELFLLTKEQKEAIDEAIQFFTPQYKTLKALLKKCYEVSPELAKAYNRRMSSKVLDQQDMRELIVKTPVLKAMNDEYDKKSVNMRQYALKTNCLMKSPVLYSKYLKDFIPAQEFLNKDDVKAFIATNEDLRKDAEEIAEMSKPYDAMMAKLQKVQVDHTHPYFKEQEKKLFAS